MTHTNLPKLKLLNHWLTTSTLPTTQYSHGVLQMINLRLEINCSTGELLQDAVCELANCSVKNFSSLTRFSGLQDFPSWRTRSASSEKKNEHVKLPSDNFIHN